MTLAVQTPDTLTITDMSWEAVVARLNRLWVVRQASHHSIMGQTRSGKSYLVSKGLLPALAKWDRLLIIDVKGDDPSLQIGKPVRRLPSRLAGARKMVEQERPFENWFRLVTYPDWADAHEQVGEAYERVFNQGDWLIYHDELRAIVDPRPPGINLRAEWERFRLRGGYRGIGLIDATQEPRWVPGSFYSQSAFYWFSRIEDEVSQKRLAEIGSGRKALMPHLASIAKRRWLYMDNEEDQRYWARTMVTTPSRKRG